jgi:hypothetical protein
MLRSMAKLGFNGILLIAIAAASLSIIGVVGYFHARVQDAASRPGRRPGKVTF